MNMDKTIVPENYKGKAVDLEEIKIENDLESAIDTYNRACSRLINPPVWSQIAGVGSATFELIATDGHEAKRLLEQDDLIKIDIPGPGPAAGDGYDWVRVVSLRENIDTAADDSFVITLRTSPNPNHEEQTTAHFFEEDATSTFIIRRKNLTITASYHGRNEVANSSLVSSLDKIRNNLVAAGAKSGISELQWTSLIKGLLKDELGGNHSRNEP